MAAANSSSGMMQTGSDCGGHDIVFVLRAAFETTESYALLGSAQSKDLPI